MATPQCMTQDGNQAAAIISMFDGGETFTLCSECLQGWTAAVLAGTLGIEPELFMAGVQAMAQQSEQEEAPAAGSPPTSDVDPTAGEPDPTADVDPSPAGASTSGNDAPATSDATSLDASEGSLVTTAEGAPTDEPPGEQPADTDGAE